MSFLWPNVPRITDDIKQTIESKLAEVEGENDPESKYRQVVDLTDGFRSMSDILLGDHKLWQYDGGDQRATIFRTKSGASSQVINCIIRTNETRIFFSSYEEPTRLDSIKVEKYDSDTKNEDITEQYSFDLRHPGYNMYGTNYLDGGIGMIAQTNQILQNMTILESQEKAERARKVENLMLGRLAVQKQDSSLEAA